MDELTISLEFCGDRICARLLDSTGAELAKDETLAVGGKELDQVRKLIATQQDRTEEIPKSGLMTAKWLLPGEVLTEWQKQVAAKPVRTILDIAPALADVAWELACTKERLFMSSNRPFLRKAMGGIPAPALPQWPLDVLVVLGSRDEDLRAIGGDKEEAAIRAVFRRRNRTVDLQVLYRPDRGTIKSYLKTHRPHVLHIIGHGSESGLELFSTKTYTTWTENAIRTDLDEAQFSPPFVYLNACRSTGRAAIDSDAFTALAPGQYAPLAQVFLDKGSRAVLAMQADIEGESAATCALTIYSSLLDGQTLDAAVALARAEIDRLGDINEAGIREKRDAYLPVLMVAGQVEDVLPNLSDLDPTPPKALIAKDADLSRVVSELVNHEGCRGGALRGPFVNTRARNLRVLYGDSDTGKTWLLGWCMDGWLRRKFDVRYVPMYPYKKWGEIVKVIVDGQDEFGALSRPLSKAQSIFYTAIGVVSSKSGKAKWPSFSSFDVQDTMESFHSALRVEAGDRELLLVLDQFFWGGTRLNEIAFNDLWQHWIEKLVLPGDGKVRVILGLSNDDIKAYKRFTIPQDAINLLPIDAERYSTMLDELLAAKYKNDYQRLRPNYDRLVQQMEARTITPKDLTDDCDLIYKMALRLKA